MENEEKPTGQPSRRSRNTIRLTFRVADGRIELVSHERLQMIAPPQPGERPQAGKHGGFWLEMRDGQGRVLAHRLIDPTQLNSVEVHSLGGTIERKFGDAEEKIFEVLLPDNEEARTVALIGEPLVRTKSEKPGVSRELAQFTIPGREKGGNDGLK